MNIYIDFDGTIFDTDLLFKDYLKLLHKYNIENNTVDDVISIIFKEEKFNLFRLTNYLCKHYNLSGKVQNELHDLFSNNYVYNDVIPILDTLNKKFNLILLTYGDLEYQTYKINSSNLACYFTNVIITKEKKNTLDINYKKSIFIDNNPNEIKGFFESGSRRLIRLRRDDDKYSKINDYIKEVSEYKLFSQELFDKCVEMGDMNE